MADLSFLDPNMNSTDETPMGAVSPDLSFLDPDQGVKPSDPSALINARELTHGMDPQRTAKVIDLSRKAGLPPRIVEERMDEIERREMLNDGLLADVASKAPKTTSFLSDPDRFAVAQTDIENLAELERLIATGPVDSFAMSGTVPRAEDNKLAKELIADPAMALVKGGLKAPGTLAELGLNLFSLVPGAIDSATRGLEQITGMPRGGYFGDLRDAALGASKWIRENYLDAEPLQISEDLRGKGAWDNPEIMLDPEWVTYVTADVLPSLIATLGAYAAGGPVAAGVVGGGMEAGGLYQELLDEGMEDWKANTASQVYGILSGTLNAIGADKVLGKGVATSWAKRLVKGFFVKGATEGATEWAEEPIQALVAGIARGDSVPTIAADIVEATQKGFDVFLPSLITGGLAGTATERMEYQKAQFAAKEQEVLDMLTENVAQSNLAQLDPVLYQEALTVLKEGGKISDIHIPASAIMSDNLAEVSEVLNQLGVSFEAFDLAYNSGDTVAIPVEQYGAAIAANPDLAARFANDRKLSADGYTRNELAQFNQEWAQEAKRVLQLAAETEELKDQEDAETKAIFEQVYAARQAAGRVPDAARLDAAQFTAALVSLAKMSEGKYTPTQLFEAYMPQVRAGQTGVDQQALQQDAAYAGVENETEVEEAGRLWAEMGTESPYFKRWFGESKVVDESGKPLVVYHGTTADFDTFFSLQHFGDADAASERLNNLETPIDAGSDVGARTSPGANLMPVYLNVQNPLRIEDTGVQHKADDLAYEAYKAGALTKEEYENRGGEKFGKYNGRVKPWLIDTLKSKGYDGFVYRNAVEGKGANSYIAFSSTQIKSATGNRGTFDPADARIQYQDNPAAIAADAAVQVAPGAEQGVVRDVEDYAGRQLFQRGAQSPIPQAEQRMDEVTGLPLNPDGTVTVYHHTSAEKAAKVKKTGRLVSAGEPHVYVTTRKETDTGYGDTAVPIRVDPELLELDDEFPDGRTDYRISVGRPGGSIKVGVGQGDQPTLEPLRARLQEMGFDEFISEREDSISVSKIALPKGARGQGLGSRAMQMITQYADSVGKRIVLSPSKDFGASSVDRLKKFYKRFGFVENKGRNKDYSISDTMYREPQGQTLFQAAYHGSPYKFSKFSLGHMGSGEGAQAYGWGLYFASRKEIADWYREKLADNDIHSGRLVIDDEEMDWKAAIDRFFPDPVANKTWKKIGENKAARHSGSYQMFMRADLMPAIREEMGLSKDEYGRVDFPNNPGQLYKVEIPEDDVMLLWDRPLSEQPEKVREGIENIRKYIAPDWLEDTLDSRNADFEELTGAEMYRVLGKALQDDAIPLNAGEDVERALEEGDGKKATSLLLNSEEIKGIKYLDGTSRSQGEGSYNYVIFDDSTIDILETFYQQQAEPQAAFTFKTKSGRPLIELFRTANQSSFLHETGHLYLEMIRDLALHENAPAPVAALWAQTKAALKIDDGPISREAHEEWARNLEAYFLEGAAPSLGLRKIFSQYAQWLRSIYKQVEQIFLQSGTQFNEDLKPVFDRIFATEKDIEEARSFYSSQKPFFAAADSKVMAKEREKYEERRLRARESMEDKRLRQLTEAWVKVSGGKAKIRAEVAEEVKARPVVAVIKGAAGGMNMAALDASVGEDLRKQLKAIGRYSSLVKKEGTVDPDILAAENGYDSAVAMVEDLISFPGEKAAITAGVEARMEAERQRISRGLAETDLAADEAYHNDDQLAVLVAEFEILSQQAAQKTKRLEASMVRDVAKQLLASEKVNFATQSSRFARLERRAAKLARAAYERGDAKKAANYKRQEVLNHAMFIESVKLKEGIKKTAARIKRGIKKTKGISPEVKTLLQGLGIQYGILPYKKERDPVRAFEMWNQDLVAKGGKIPTIEGWVEEMRKLGISAPLDPFLNNAAAVPYQQITVGQFRALEEGVRILRRVDRGLHTVTWIDGSTITMEDAIERLQAHVAGRGGKAPDPLTYDPNAVTLAARNFFAEHTKTSTIIQALDNWEAGGLFYQLIYRPVMDADSDLSARWATEAPKIKALFEPIRRQLRKKVVVLGKARPRAQLVAVALNVGNQGNRERLIAGLGINEAQLDQLLAPLTTEEMDFVQAVWDYIATFKDEAFAVERRLTGREPAAVDPVPFVFKGKTYAGGYYPVSYDKNLRDQKGEARDAKEALDELFGGTPAGTAMTAHGHLEARASAGTGERLSQELSVISDHVAQVLRDITHREAVVNVAKLLKNKQIMAMITDVVGREKAKQLWPWLVSVSKEGREQIQLTAVEKMLLHFRPAMTFYTQAYKVGTALMQAAGFFQVFEFVQAKHVGQAVWQLYGKGLLSLNMFSDGEVISHPLIKEIREKSPQMNERLLNADRDIRDATKEFSTSESALVAYKKAGFKATVAMQFYVADVVAWQGAYLQALTDGMAEQDAINRADFVVEQAMGAGYTRSLSKIQRGGSIQRFLTMFYTFGSVLYNLAARRAGITKKQLASGQYGAAALGASSFLVLQWVMPVLLETLVRGDMVDDDDDETLAEKLLVNLLTYPAQSVLIARELSGIAKGFKYRFSPALKPFESVGQWISSVARAIEQEDASIAAKPTAQLVGTTTGLIPAQFINSGEILTDYLTGEDQELSVKELLYGKRRQ